MTTLPEAMVLFSRTTAKKGGYVPIEEDILRYQNIAIKRSGREPDTVRIHDTEQGPDDFPPIGMVLVTEKSTPPGHFILEVSDD